MTDNQKEEDKSPQVHATGDVKMTEEIKAEVQPIIDIVETKIEEKSNEGPGRPSVMGELTLQKLEVAFKVGCSDEEACFYADISPRTLYNYQSENEEFTQMKVVWKKRPVLKARQVVVQAIENNDLPTAKWYLEKNWDVEEFGDKVKHSGDVRHDLVPHASVNEYRIKLNEAMTADIKAYWQKERDKKLNENS